MKKTIFLLFFIALLACNSRTETRSVNPQDTPKANLEPNFNVALKFINSYAQYCEPGNKGPNEKVWIKESPLLTDGFKSRFQNILDSAEKQDPELGLDSDPIFDAQDFPDKGFSILEVDKSSGYVTVVGNDWKEFKLVLRVVSKGNEWLVDGAGIINIPPNMRAPR